MAIYNPNIEVVIKNPLLNFLRVHAKNIREHASGIVSMQASKEDTDRYKKLLFEAAKLMDEASHIIPEDNPVTLIKREYPWWAWLAMGWVLATLLYFGRYLLIN